MNGQATCDLCSWKKLQTVPDNWKEIDTQILKAIGAVREEGDLFKFHASERAISHRLGCHLQWLLQKTKWSVDCDYNRAGPLTKAFPREELIRRIKSLKDSPPPFLPRRGIELEIVQAVEDVESTSERDRPRRVAPSIVIHNRGCDCYNVLTIEMKVTETPAPCTLLDWAKLSLFTEGSHTPNYRFGLYVDFDFSETRPWLFSNKEVIELSLKPSI